MEPLMTESITLLNAQLSFLNTRVALIHVPLSLYPLFVHPILRILIHNEPVDDDPEPEQPSRPWKYWHPFVNISVTPNECSIVCPRPQADAWFAPILQHLKCSSNVSSEMTATISENDYSVIAIEGPGTDAGARVLDLSSPLAMAGIPIFFFTTYYADFILVPCSARERVIGALEDRGFVFETDATKGGEAGVMTNPASPLLASSSIFPFFHQRKSSTGSTLDISPTVSTPPATSIPELQARTFQLLRKHDIHPSVDRAIKLVTCGGYKDVTASTSAANFTQGKLQLGLAKCLTLVPPPTFLSLTLTNTDSLSVTLEPRLLEHFHHGGEDLLLGKDGPAQVPITFDLGNLPLASTGIVCGVASRLVEGMKGRLGVAQTFDLSYLSSAKAGHVVVYEEELDAAVEALKGLETDSTTIPRGNEDENEL